MKAYQIADVARYAKVSPATVSRVLNNTANVSNEMRKKVLHAVKELQYRPNQMGQALRTKKSNMLLVVVSDMGNSFFSDILYGMDETAQRYGYNLLVVSTYFNAQRELKMLEFLDNKTVDGSVLLATNLIKEDIDRYASRYPIIQCCEYVEDANAPHISIDNYSAACQVVKYFINAGHNRIAYIGQNNTFISSNLRESAYVETLKENNIPYRPEYVKKGSHSFDFGVTSMQELLKLEERPTAAFVISDRIAAGCLRALAYSDVSVPDEMSIIGFDNIDISKMVTPPLSTVAQPMRQLGNMAIEMLIEKICGYQINKNIYLDHEIILRKST
jgi:LacI family repressor for deo operon, udp, cdd, tsx, nupC, and nupG